MEETFREDRILDLEEYVNGTTMRTLVERDGVKKEVVVFTTLRLDPEDPDFDQAKYDKLTSRCADLLKHHDSIDRVSVVHESSHHA